MGKVLLVLVVCVIGVVLGSIALVGYAASGLLTILIPRGTN